MHIGMITDSLGALSFDDLLPTAAELGIEQLEFAGGNWSTAPHLALDTMLDSAAARSEFAAKLHDHGLSISALLGNRCIPGEIGRYHQEMTHGRVLAGLMVSGGCYDVDCPAGRATPMPVGDGGCRRRRRRSPLAERCSVLARSRHAPEPRCQQPASNCVTGISTASARSCAAAPSARSVNFDRAI